MKQILTVLFFHLAINLAYGQTIPAIELNKEFTNVQVSKSSNPIYKLKLVKDGIYEFLILQKGIDVSVLLTGKSNNTIIEQDTPNGSNGPEKFEYTSGETNDFFLIIKRLDEAGNPDSGIVNIFIKKLTKAEIQAREKIKKELEPENNKNVQTLDIDHFWEAFDNLKNCKSHSDSVASFQKLYIDRATNGLIDFIQVRDFTAEKFTKAVARFPKFYTSVRQNTYEVKKAAPLIDEVFVKFSELYPNFKPFKVCFAIGIINTGGTVSGKFVLIGTEVTTSTKDVDLSEFNNSSFGKVLAGERNLVQKVKNIVSHECVHTQQKKALHPDAIQCNLLTSVLAEGFCDFIGELVAGGQINSVAREYGDKHEKQLWTELKNELCNESVNNWLYNYSSVKDKPADLGYYMGYKIAQEYYKNATNKKQAIIDIIEMDDPIRFLELSKYDQKFR